jgi:cytidylate kinase
MDTNIKRLTIAIDGHSSCGKSTVAKELAKKLGYIYIDSGAMYRAVTLYCIEHNLIQNNQVDLVELKKGIETLEIHFTYDQANQKHLTWLNNRLVENEIRQIQVADKVSLVSTIGFVREKMVNLQQQMGSKGGIVMDGRDIGTVVFPHADLKIFMTASVEVRAQRRYDELLAKGEKVTFSEVKENIAKRDYIDQNRDIAPLRQAPDAYVLDNSYLTRDEQFQKILELVNLKFK